LAGATFKHGHAGLVIEVVQLELPSYVVNMVELGKSGIGWFIT